MSAAAANVNTPDTQPKQRAVRPPASWPIGPRERPGVARSTATRLLDIGHRVVVTGIVVGTAYLAYQMAAGVYTIRKRRIAWEAEHPEEVEAFVAKQKADKEAEKEKKERDRAEKTAILNAKLAEEEAIKQQQQLEEHNNTVQAATEQQRP